MLGGGGGGGRPLSCPLLLCCLLNGSAFSRFWIDWHCESISFVESAKSLLLEYSPRGSVIRNDEKHNDSGQTPSPIMAYTCPHISAGAELLLLILVVELNL